MDKQGGELGILGRQAQSIDQRNRGGHYNRVGVDQQNGDAHGQSRRGLKGVAVETGGLGMLQTEYNAVVIRQELASGQRSYRALELKE